MNPMRCLKSGDRSTGSRPAFHKCLCVILWLIVVFTVSDVCSLLGCFPQACRQAWACSGRVGPPPAAVARQHSAVSPFKAGLHCWPSTLSAGEGPPAGPRATSEPVLVILYKFKDSANPFGTSSDWDWDLQFWAGWYGVSKYWDEVSYGNLALTQAPETGGGQNNDGFVGWYTSNFNSTDARYDAGDGYLNRGQIVYDAIVASDPNVDYSQFDQDGDGYISDDELHIVVIVAAYEASYDDAAPSPKLWRMNLWMTDTPGNYPVVDGKNVCVQGHGTAAIVGERYYMGSGNPSVRSQFGIICHEIGHQLGFPDMYDTDGSSLCWGGMGQGLGHWDLMASGDWLTPRGYPAGYKPAHVSAWLKAYRGWLIPTEVVNDVHGIDIPDVETNPVAYKLWTGGQYGAYDKEYFLVESRQRMPWNHGYDSELDGDGLLIYHVDESVKDGDADGNGINNWDDNELEWDATHEFIDVECADGFTRNADGSACPTPCSNCARDDLDVWTWHYSSNDPNVNDCDSTADFFNRGDFTDPWYLGNFGNHSNDIFDANSCPSSRDYNSNDTQVAVRNIGPNGFYADLIVGSNNPNPSDFWIKDCDADVGNEPDAECQLATRSSPDVWIDNDGDGVQDPLIYGHPNRFHIRLRNRGLGPAVNTFMSLYHRNNSLGLAFPTGAMFDNLRVIPLIPPADSVIVELVVDVPSALPAGAWAYGVYLTHAGLNDDGAASVEESNNKAAVTATILDGRAGQVVPASFYAENPDDDSSPGGGWFDFEVRSDLPTGWQLQFLPGVQLPVYIPKGGSVQMYITITPPAGDHHGFAGTVQVRQYWVSPPLGTTGTIEYRVYQDNRPPEVITDLAAEATTDSTGGGAAPLAIRLSWTPVVRDVGGTPEMIQNYEVHRSLTDNFTPVPETLIGTLAADQDTIRSGFQYYDHDPALDEHVRYYYRVVPIDLVQWQGAPSNVASAIAAPIVPFADLDVGNIVCTVTDRGIVGFLDGTQTQGSGFIFPKGGTNQLYIGGLWVGQSSGYIANRDYDADPQKEWEVPVDPEGYVAASPGPADQGYTCAFVDSAGANSLGLIVRQDSYAWADGGAARYAILRYRIENRSGGTLGGLYAGLFCDWDAGSQYLHNGGRAEPDRDLVYVDSPGEGLWLGARLLKDDSSPPTANLTLIDNATYVWPSAYVPDADKYLFLSAGDAAHVLHESPQLGDYGGLVSAGPITLGSGEVTEVVFALVAGSNLDALREAADQADARYPFDAVNGVPEGALAAAGRTFLAPNQPNPFQGSTGISFHLRERGPAELSVFDVQGKRICRLLDGELPVGWHRVVWDGRDDAGRPAASGAYFLRLRTTGLEQSHRMILLR